MTETFIELAFGSNLIQRAGLNPEITVRICRTIFKGKDVNSDNLELQKFEYQAALETISHIHKNGKNIQKFDNSTAIHLMLVETWHTA
jgi:hypothetical protein